jgi:cyclopropane fatty-acyl-phospholipid synthase-like methyltransferase
MTNSQAPIKTMKLYTHVERVERELAARGFGPDQLLTIEELFNLDQLHYHGPDAVRAAIHRLALKPGDRVLDVGSGLGGPARILAGEGECRVTAVELQEDLNRLAGSLTRRTGLDDRIDHRCEDFLTASLPESPFDALVSWLTFLHIPEREALLGRCHACLRPGGRILVEDFYARPGLSAEQQAVLAKDVYCTDLPSWQRYREQIEAAGFEAIEMEDMTTGWHRFVADRLDDFHQGRERFVTLHGQDAFEALRHFYSVIVELFGSGGLGGVRWSARRAE